MAKILINFPELKVEKQWITGDARTGRGLGYHQMNLYIPIVLKEE